MKRWITMQGCVAIAALLVISTPSSSWAEMTLPGTWGLGVTSGYDIPVAQDDTRHGATFGVRGRYGLLRNLELESNAFLLRNTNTETNSGFGLEAPSLSALSVGAVLKTGGTGWGGTANLGLGWARLDERTSDGALLRVSLVMGLGIERDVGPLRLDVGPRFLIVRTESGASRKHLSAVLGATYYFD